MHGITAKATPEGTLNYTYDAAGHVASIASSNTNGASMFYTYDSLDRLSTVVDNRLSGSNATTYNCDDANNVATVTPLCARLVRSKLLAVVDSVAVPRQNSIRTNPVVFSMI
jgi:YD repeat-containing protein